MTGTLTLAGVGEVNDGVYDVLIGNTVGTMVSSSAILGVHPITAPGTTLTTLHSFSGSANGFGPNGLMLASNGILYGTTRYGRFGGTVFSVATNGTVATVATLGAGKGFSPIASLVQDDAGNFYGSTVFGGTNDDGNIFEMSPAGAVTNFYSFSGGDDGGSPTTALIRGADGNFLGTTGEGGIFGAGNVFRITPSGVFTNLYSFTGGLDGNFPGAGLTAGPDGNYYGTTQNGGDHDAGTIFKLTPAGALTTIYSFSGANDGAIPNGLVWGGDGYFYGTTQSGGSPLIINFLTNYPNGTVFRISTNGALSHLHLFTGGADGSVPKATLTPGPDGNFYGTTEHGGAIGDNGTVFRLAPGGAFVRLVSFNGSDDGSSPEAALVAGPDGSIYGTTPDGGASDQGVVFRLAFTSAPQITANPVSQIVIAGTTVEVGVAVFGQPPLFYQWRQNGTNLTDGGGIAGSTNRVLQFTDISLANAGTYSVVVSNALGVVVSGGALLTVQTPPPVLQGVTAANGAFSFAWNSAPGRRYQVQYASNLNPTIWSNSGAVITASGAITATTQAIAEARRFYRVVLVP